MTRVVSIVLAALGVLALAGVERPSAEQRAGERAEVVVALASPPLGVSPAAGRRIAAEQAAFEHELTASLPDAVVRWRYRLVVNGFALALPSTQVPRLRALPGVSDVYSATAYGPQLDRSPGQIGASALWGPTLSTSGQGVKIGIIDSGIDRSHPFFDPAGYTMPAGYPKGQTRFTSSKVIVARAFPPLGARQPSARLAFAPSDSSHGTHVAGIAAGNPRTSASGDRIVSGVAPRAYLGNYKVFVETDSGLSPNANSPAIVAAVEAAVADGMDIINFSGGEPEIEPGRDIVALALDAAAAAGVVPVVAAGNDYQEAGAGSVSSPANSEGAIAVAAVETNGAPPRSTRADFSSVGPTAISLRLKPDVSAPGVDILSSVPDGWAASSGTSMAAPHVAGAAALLRQRHPTWTAAQVKSALVQTGTDSEGDDGALGPTFQGGGVVALQRADAPLVFAEPTAVSFGLLPRPSRAGASIQLGDAGGGAGAWQVTELRSRSSTGGASLVLPSSVDVPGTLTWEVAASETAREGEVSGYIQLRRGSDLRRIPFWGRVTAPALGGHRLRPLTRGGLHRATTGGRPSLVTRYRFPEDPSGMGVTTVLRGSELVYRVRLRAAVANFGVVVTHRAPRVRVEPRVVVGLDENRLTGYAGLPLAHNPYLEGFQSSVPAAGALSPRPGDYAVVFDSATRSGAGSFTFRYWVNDVKPPTLRLRARTVERGDPLLVTATDGGSGVYPASVQARLDRAQVSATLRGNLVRIPTAGLSPGRHRLALRVSDYQETKNTENVARVLPNTRTLMATITVR